VVAKNPRVPTAWCRPVSIEAAARELQSVGYTVSEHPNAIQPEMVAAAASAWQQRKAGFLSRMQLRGVGDHLEA
jgi:hypothetical protein